MRASSRSRTGWWRRLVLVSVTGALVLGLPAAASASPPQEKKGTVVDEFFVSAERLRAAGLLVDKSDPGPGIEPQWGCVFDCWYLRFVTYTGETNVFRTQAKGSPGPMTLTLQTTLTVSNSFTANVGLKASVVSAGVGFNVTWSASQTYTAQTSVPAGACRIIKAYDSFRNYKFEVWDQNFIGDPFKVGSGTAKRFMGVWYRVFTC